MVTKKGLLEKVRTYLGHFTGHLLKNGGILLVPRQIGTLYITKKGDNITIHNSEDQYGFVPFVM